MKALAARLLSSPAIWIVLCLLAVDACVTYAKPLQYVQYGWIINTNEDPLGTKLNAMVSDRRKFDIVLIGSSLGMSLCRADYRLPEYAGDQKKIDTLSTQIKYLDGILQNKLGRKVTTFNLAVPGSMISDDHAILEYLLENNLTPGQLLLTLAPRDFLDNHFSAETSLYRQALELRSDPLIGLKSSAKKLFDMSAHSSSPAARLNDCLSELWAYYRVRADYRRLVEYIACNWTERPPTLYDAVKTDSSTYSRNNLKTLKFSIPTSKFSNDNRVAPAELHLRLNGYRQAYNPVNHKRMQQEFGYLNQLLSCARRNNIPTIVAYMPLTADNLALLSPSAAEEIKTKLKNACDENGVTFLDLNNQRLFANSDFVDDVHLNCHGSAKFCDTVADELQQMSTRQERLD
jgi:hypothetical protein